MSVGLSGARLGHLVLGRVLGVGGMSTVYQAFNCRSRGVVACKIMHGPARSDPGLRAQFSRPPTVVQHPHLVPILEMGECGEYLFLTMPLITGTDLATSVATGGTLTASRAVPLMSQLAAALEAIHQHGLLHLDVKPANVLLTKGSALLSDFGLSTADEHGHAIRTTAGEFVGSPAYASPEHLRGEQVGPAADVYSLACLIFTVLSGQPPYSGDLRSVIRGHLGTSIPSLSARTGLPVAVDVVMDSALSQQPARRPSGPSALVHQTQVALDLR